MRRAFDVCGAAGGYARRRTILFDCRLIAMSFVVNVLGKSRARRLLFGR